MNTSSSMSTVCAATRGPARQHLQFVLAVFTPCHADGAGRAFHAEAGRCRLPGKFEKQGHAAGPVAALGGRAAVGIPYFIPREAIVAGRSRYAVLHNKPCA